MKFNLGSLRGTIRAKAFTAENGTSTRRLERHRILLAALIAGNLESFAFPATSSGGTKVGTARVPAGLATLWMSQVAFLIIFLFTLGERKSVSAFGASDLDVWHVAVLPRVQEPLTFRALIFETWGEPSCFVLLGLRQDEDAINRPVSLAVAQIPKRSSVAEFTPASGMVQ